ncbi:alpha/beta hydrolase [Streptomyces sp. NPDC006551]|uniref:alpha/beta fold hydrolase n=1 Tax=Streptomyces sp. NPDC006551 TaxID=3157178 RepID=UPI0033AE3E4F
MTRAHTRTCSWTRRTVIRDGVRLSCRDWAADGRNGCGSRPPIVLLHGLAGHVGEWDTIARLLCADGYRVVAVDQRGHGDSERFPRDTSRAAYVADTIAVLDHLGLQRPVLIGQSLGGHTAMLTAAAHPGRLSGLVLVEAGPGGPNPGVTEEIGGWLDSWPVPFPSREAAVRFLGGGPVGEAWADGLEERDAGEEPDGGSDRDGGMKPNGGSDRDGREGGGRGLWPRFDPGVMVRSLAENAARAFWDEWEAVDCPTLAVVAQNGIVKAAEFDGMVRRQPAMWAVSVPGTGHDVHLERPDALHHVLLDFLVSHRSCLGAHSNS